MVEYIANQDSFEDIYPDSEPESSSESDDDAGDAEVPDQPGLVQVKLELVELSDKLQQAKEAITSADQRIKILDGYCTTLNKRDDINIASILATYKEERENASRDRMYAREQERTINDALKKTGLEHTKLLNMQKKLQKKANKAKDKIRRLKNKRSQQIQRRKHQIAQEKERIRQERLSVWPKEVYKITIQLEVNAAFTPASSRRGSVSSEADVLLHRSPSKTMDVDEPVPCDLVLSYVTSFAYWTPSYDLQLSTTTATGSLCFDACLKNMTSESWENCKITLSTSQTAFSGTNDEVPILQPWRIKIASKGNLTGSDPNLPTITDSARELIERAVMRDQKRGIPPPPRELLFGQPVNQGGSNHALQDYQMQLMLLEQQNKKRLMMARQEQDVAPNSQAHNPQAPVQFQNFSNSPPPQGSMQNMQMRRQLQMQQQLQQQQQQQQFQQQGQMQQQMQQQMQRMPPPPPPPRSVLPSMGAQIAQNPMQPSPQGTVNPMDLDMPTLDSDLDVQPALDFQESLIEETGLTTTYDLPGHKTLRPKTTATKQRVARINFTNVTFNHIVLAKYHAAAYLKATLKNLSKWALLKGPGSLTLDGSFMGRVTIPRCSAGDGFTLSLGVDPALRIMYPKAEVKRSTTGMFSKGDSSEFARSITVHNTRATSSKPIKLFVFDQVPISEDERLRVELTSPRGLTLNGPRLPAGAPGRDTPAGQDWGTGTVALRKLGMVSWEVSLNPGKIVKLGLEYTVAMPVGETAEECGKQT